MRRWQIKQGNHIGWHFIYDTEQEAAICLKLEWFQIKDQRFYLSEIGTTHIIGGYPIEETFKHWTDLTVRKGDWVRTDDGRICQVLEWYVMKNSRRCRGERKYKTHEEHPDPLTGDTIYVRLPFTSGAVYIKANGVLTYKYIHADFFVKGAWNNPIRTRLASTSNAYNVNSRLTKEKQVYAYFLALTGNPVKAYRLAFPGHYTSKILYKQITKRAMNLFRDKHILKEVMCYMTIEEFRKKLEDGLTEAGLDHKFIFKELKRGTEGAKAGTDDHQHMILMTTEVVEKILQQPVLTTKSTIVSELPPGHTNGTLLVPIPKDEIKDKVIELAPEIKEHLE